MNKSEIHNSYMQEMKDLHAAKPIRKHRRILVTGAGREGSIGLSLAVSLSYGNITRCFEGDIRDPANVRENLLRQEYDAIILCHGITHLDWIENSPVEKMKEIFDVNLFGTALIASEFVSLSIGSPFRKTIIIIGSMARSAVLNGSAAYCASKAGVAHLGKCLAWELAPKGYDVFVINPSNTADTPMTNDTIEGLMRYRNLSRAEAEAYWGASLPKANWLQKSDINELAAFLLSGKAEYLSGAQLDLAGGQR